MVVADVEGGRTRVPQVRVHDRSFPVYDSSELEVSRPSMAQVKELSATQLLVKYRDSSQLKAGLLDDFLLAGTSLPQGAEIHYFNRPGKPDLIDPKLNDQVYSARREKINMHRGGQPPQA